jgi:uncharacterized protein YqjF (DUF2071 family)
VTGPSDSLAFSGQHWDHLTFVHWPVDPATVAHLFPHGTRPDVFTDGNTYVGLVPFAMHDVSLGAAGMALPIPYFGDFLETNVRLYSVDAHGRHGVVFRSLETERLAVVGLTRALLGVPYTWAHMRMVRTGDRITYTSRRRWPARGLSSRLTVETGELVEPTVLEVWLTSRWGAHTRKLNRTWWMPVEHETWPLYAARIVELDEDLVEAGGVRRTGDPLRALFSPRVTARFGAPALVVPGG